MAESSGGWRQGGVGWGMLCVWIAGHFAGRLVYRQGWQSWGGRGCAGGRTAAVGRWRGCVHSIAMLCEAARPLQAQRSPPAHRPDGAPLPLQWRRWLPEGGMQMLTGSSRWFRCGAQGWRGPRLQRAHLRCTVSPPSRTCHVPSWSLQYTPLRCNSPPFPSLLPHSREEVVRGLRKDHSITSRIARRNAAPSQQQQQQQQDEGGQLLQEA